MTSYLVIANYLQLLAFFIWSSNAVVILYSSLSFTSRNFRISRSTCGSYSVGNRPRNKISIEYRGCLSQKKSLRLDYMKGNDINDKCASSGGNFLDEVFNLKRPKKRLHLLNGVQPGKPVEITASFAEKLNCMKGREIAEAIFVSGECTGI